MTEPGSAPKKRKSKVLKVLLVFILLLAAAAAAATYRLYKVTEASLDVRFAEDTVTIEFGEERPAMDLVSGYTGEIASNAAALDTTAVGEKAITYTVSQPILGGLLTPEREFTLNYTVVDTVPPLKLWSGDGSVIERGTEFDIQELIAYGDNADPAPAIDVDGKVDTETIGEYPLHVSVTDASGNSTDWDLTVEVAESLPTYEDNAERTAFSDFTSAYADDGRSFGIDVSVWQGDVDFEAVRKAGCEFAIIRIGYSEGGELTLDSQFDDNLRKAKAAGLKIGVYVYTADNSEEQIRAVADQVTEKLGGESLDLPVAFDWEDFGHFQSYGMSFAGLNSLYDAFADQMSQSGYDCMLYSSKIPLEVIWEQTDTRPIWLAHYTDKTDYKGPYILWQASCTGRIDGIDGDVDMDILFD